MRTAKTGSNNMVIIVRKLQESCHNVNYVSVLIQLALSVRTLVNGFGCFHLDGIFSCALDSFVVVFGKLTDIFMYISKCKP